MTVTDDIRAKLDIVEVVAPYVTLQQSGRTLKANCPFHTEKTPSFIVNPERQSWHCFGACSTGGDMFSFVMRAENMEFGDTLRMLARRAGVELQPARDRAVSNAVHSVNSVAADFYQRVLASEAGQVGREYLDQRDVDAASRDRFKLGLSPNGWDGLVRYLNTHDVKIEDAIRAGLVRQADGGQPYDFFRNRLMFPISDRDGNIVGFGARALDDSNPKYINTAATEAFDKRNTLYALNLAAPTIRQSGTAVIVEGYMDAIAAHEHGYTNVVASMGTALTENQVSQLRLLAQNYVLALDPDAAGQEATLRSLESSWRVFRSVVTRRSASSQSVLSQWTPPALKIAELPDGLDPDALIRTDQSRWESTVSEAQPLLDFVIPALVGRTDLRVPDSRAKIARELAGLINQLDEMDQYDYWNKLAGALGVPIESLRASIGGRRDRPGRRRVDSTRTGSDVEISSDMLSSSGTDPLEEYALALLVQHPVLLRGIPQSDTEYFRLTENRQLFTEMLACPTIGELKEELEPTLNQLLSRLENIEWRLGSPPSERKARTSLRECLRRLEVRHVRDLQGSLLQVDARDKLPSWEVQRPIQELNQRLRELESATVG